MADDSNTLKQSEIEDLLKQAQGGAPIPAAPASNAAPAGGTVSQSEIEALLASKNPGAAATVAPPAARSAPSKDTAHDTGIQQQDIELLLAKAEAAIRSVDEPGKARSSSNARPFALADLGGAPPSTESATIGLLRDVELDLKIELGRTHMQLEDVLKLRKGAVVPLDKLAGDPVDIYVNGRLIARGEVLVLNDNFCVRVAELVASDPTL